ncbi:MAG: LysR family transcriptional regulator [Verrucomicrobiales bacterium]|nr:LysR family transcriptional regulator [Verrucomicrobiales bacterium]
MKPILDGQQLRVFVTLARTLNMRRAAGELGLTASAVSHGLKALERDLGCQLFLRTRSQLALSPAGHLLLEEARQILDAMQQARHRMHSWTSQSDDRLRLASSAVALRQIVGPALREFRESFPSFTIALSADSGAGASAVEGATAGRMEPDFRLLPDAGSEWRSRAIPIGEDDLHFYAHPLHPWVIRRSVDRDELACRRLILPEAGTPLGDRVRAYFQEEDLRLQPFVEVSDELAVLEFIRLDLGVGILPRWVAAEAMRHGAVVELPLGRRRLKRAWSVVPRREGALTLPESLLVDLLRKVFRVLSPERSE